MSTNCMTVITDSKSSPSAENICCIMYRHYDGYVSGHGHDLAGFLSGFKIVNGLRGNEEKIANGTSCLAAQVVANFKDGAGGIYLYPLGSDFKNEQYAYIVNAVEGLPLKVTVLNRGKEIFSGTPEELALFEEPEED
jgi:hypothetical protein